MEESVKVPRYCGWEVFTWIEAFFILLWPVFFFTFEIVHAEIYYYCMSVMVVSVIIAFLVHIRDSYSYLIVCILFGLGFVVFVGMSIYAFVRIQTGSPPPDAGEVVFLGVGMCAFAFIFVFIVKAFLYLRKTEQPVNPPPPPAAAEPQPQP